MGNIDSATFAYTGRDNLEAMRHAHRYNAFLEDMVEKAGASHACWLDFGAGTGQFAVPFTQKGRQVIALEPDALLVKELVQKGVNAYTDISTIADQSIDFAYSLNVLEHIEDDQEALNMLAKKLKSDGKLLIYVPAFPSLFSEMDHLVGHHRRYRKHGLTRIVTQAGFKVDRCTYVDSLGYLASALYKRLPNQTGVVSPQSVAIYDRFVFPMSRVIDRATSTWFGKNLVLIAHK